MRDNISFVQLDERETKGNTRSMGNYLLNIGIDQLSNVSHSLSLSLLFSWIIETEGRLHGEGRMNSPEGPIEFHFLSSPFQGRLKTPARMTN